MSTAVFYDNVTREGLIMNKDTATRNDRRRQHTRSKLIRAAAALVLEKGYDSISVQDITDRADLGRGTFYIHFRDKEDIVWSAIKEGLDDAHAEGSLPLAEGRAPERLELYMYRNFFELAERNRKLYRIMLGSRSSAALSARAQEYLAADLIREEGGIGAYPDTDVPKDVWAQIVSGAVFSLLVWWLEKPNSYTAEQMAGMLHKTLHAGKLQ
jgi:AcrR family transcriptional regulator